MLKVKLFFVSPDLTNYPFFWFQNLNLMHIKQVNGNHRHSVFLFRNSMEIKLSRFKFFQNFFRNSLVVSENNAVTTITRDLNIKRDSNKSTKKELLVIYIDGLSSFVSKESNVLQYLMPQTYKYFNTSTIYENYYGVGEWTLPNYASLMTGTLQNSHGYIHSAKKRNKVSDKLNHPLIHEYLADAGFVTNVISAVPYINPNFKFHVGTENFIFSKNINSEGIVQLFQHTEMQSKNHNITWLHFMDIHHKLRGTNDTYFEPNNQLVNELISSYRFTRKDAENFASRARSLDCNLAKLFNMEYTNMYENIVLVSDHGSTRLNTAWDKCLDDARTKTTLMVKKKNQKKHIYIKEQTTHLSFIRIVCELLNIKIPFTEEEFLKKFVLIQSIYEGKPYRARIKGPGIDFNFVGSKSNGVKPYINLLDIEDLLNNSTLKIFDNDQKLILKNLLLGH